MRLFSRRQTSRESVRKASFAMQVNRFSIAPCHRVNGLPEPGGLPQGVRRRDMQSTMRMKFRAKT